MVHAKLLRGGWFNVLSGTVGFACAAIVVYILVQLVAGFVFEGAGSGPGVITRVLKYEGLTTVIANTVLLVLSSMSLSLIIGGLFAWLMERTDARIDWLAGLLPMFSMMLLPVAGTIGWVFLLAPGAGFLNALIRWGLDLFGISLTSGPLTIYSWPGMILLYAAYQIPFSFLIISAGLKNSDPSLEEAARIGGASLSQTLWHITIPTLAPSIGAAALYIIWFGFSLFSVPVVIGPQAGVKVLAVEIVQLVTFTYPTDIGVAIGLSIFLIVILGTAWHFQSRVLRANRHASLGGKGKKHTTIKLGRARTWAKAALFLYIALTFVLPLGALILVSANGYWTTKILWAELDITNLWTAVANNRAAFRALFNSLSLSVLGATLTVCVAAMFSLYVRGSGSRWSQTLDAIIKLPSALSAIVIGLGFVLAFAGPPFNMGNTFGILLLCYLVLFLPQATISADAAAAQIDRQLSEASRVAGAGGGRTFLAVSVPLMLPGLIGAWGLLFVWMTGELNASIMLSGTKVPVLGFQILQIFQTGGFPVLASLSLLLTLINIAVLSVAHLFERRIGEAISGRMASRPAAAA